METGQSIQSRGGRNRNDTGGGRGPNRGWGSGGKCCREDSSFINLTDGTTVEFHPFFSFLPQIYQKMKASDKARLKQQKIDYKNQKERKVQQVVQ